MQAADFSRGLFEHKKIAHEAERLSRKFDRSEIGREAGFYVLHSRRQQTECLRSRRAAHEFRAASNAEDRAF
jgi:hypothetical protein